MDPTSTLIMCKFECHGPDALPVAQLSFSFVKVISNPADLPCWESSTWGLSGLGVVWGRPQCQFYYAATVSATPGFLRVDKGISLFISLVQYRVTADIALADDQRTSAKAALSSNPNGKE